MQIYARIILWVHTNMIVAPQAPFEESATTEASRRCPLTGFLREFRVMFWGHVLEVFANGICVLAVQNTTPEMLRIGQNLSGCLSVWLSVCNTFFAATFSMNFMKNSFAFSRKNHSKKGIQGEIRRLPGLDFGLATLPRSLHSPQMATAAPPPCRFVWWRRW